jgi:hypothetical protein
VCRIQYLNSIQRFLAFCVTLRNALVMAKQEVAFPGFSVLLAFGAGVAVGANWPRASNFVGFILQRLGFELTDLALWMWDPEKSLAREAEITSVKRAKSKRAQALMIQDGNPNSKRVGGKVKVKTIVSPGNHPSGTGVTRARRRKAANDRKPWIRSEELNGVTARGNGNSTLIKSSKAGSRGRRTVAGKKSKRATVRSEGKTSSTGRGRKISKFPGMILPAEAALN